MPSPPIQLFLTSLTTTPQLRTRQEYILQILHASKIPFTSFDLACDGEAKNLWKRKAPQGKQQLPGILVGGRCPGDVDALEVAVENGELDAFLRLKETWDAAVDGDGPALEVKPVGIPGAVPITAIPTPKATPKQSRPGPLQRGLSEPLKSADRGGLDKLEVGSELQDLGLERVRATDEELRKLVEELGLDGDDAADMVKNLGGAPSSSQPSRSGTGELPSRAEDRKSAKENASKDVL